MMRLCSCIKDIDECLSLSVVCSATPVDVLVLSFRPWVSVSRCFGFRGSVCHPLCVTVRRACTMSRTWCSYTCMGMLVLIHEHAHARDLSICRPDAESARLLCTIAVRRCSIHILFITLSSESVHPIVGSPRRYCWGARSEFAVLCGVWGFLTNIVSHISRQSTAGESQPRMRDCDERGHREKNVSS